MLFDAGHSVYQNGLLELRYTNDSRPYPVHNVIQVVNQLDSEPLQAYAASVMIWLAGHLPGIGMMQLAWTLNIFVTALTAVVLYHYGLALGYRERSALGVSLIYALATYAWSYSRLFFREPLFTLMFFACAYSLQRWRQRAEAGRFSIGWFSWLALALVTFFAALLTKETSLIMIPALLGLAVPGLTRRLFTWKTLLLAIVLIVIFVGGLALLPTVFPGQRYQGLAGLWGHILGAAENRPYLIESLSAYLISPGYSLWSLSPALLLALPGAYLLARSRRLRELIVPLIALISLTFGYSLIQGANWYGGLGWGARYLLPLTPFLALWLLPVIDRLLNRRLPRWTTLLVISIVVESIFIQLIAVSLPLSAYTDYLSAESVALKRSPDTPIVEIGRAHV